MHVVNVFKLVAQNAFKIYAKKIQSIVLLVNKFKLKYGNNANISKFIDNEVQKFLANDRLTETNLLGLDEKIGKEAN